MNDRKLDDAIDHAVREMTSVDARVTEDMRARVLAKIETAAPAFPWVRLAAGAVCATLVIAALMLVRSRDTGIAPRPAPSDVARSSPSGDPPRPASAVRRPAPERVSSPLGASGPRRVTATVVDDAASERIAEIDPLAVIDPIAVPPLEHESFAPSRIAISPLAPIAEIQMEPLSPSGGRD
jgi:hypothetical protein